MTMSNRGYQERFLTRSRTIDCLRNLEVPGAAHKTLYIAPEPGEIPGWEWLPPNALRSPNGLMLVEGQTGQIAFGAPFGIRIEDGDRVADGPNFGPFVASLAERRVIAFILLRLGAYAVGVANDERLVASKTGTRYVKGRHRAGGQSQRRLERNREVWIASLYERVCKTASDRIAPFERELDGLAIGGDRHVIEGFTKRCGFIERLRRCLPVMDVPVDRPGLKALERAVTQVWGCQTWGLDKHS